MVEHWKSRVRIRRDEVGLFVGLLRVDGTYERRTLSTPDQRRALRWLTQALRHGFNDHHRACGDCRGA